MLTDRPFGSLIREDKPTKDLWGILDRHAKPITFDAIRIKLASPEKIRGWSHGEVKKPETINYRTFKPERDGLFCARIFGPTKDYECACGKYKRMKFAGVVCDKCGVEVTRARVRRERMGHIGLASPVSHVWFFKGLPSRIGQLLDMSLRELEKILYFEEYVVLDTRLQGVKKKDLMAVDKARKLQEEHGAESLKVGMGAEAIRELLRDMDLDSLARDLRAQMLGETSVQKRKKIVKRLKVIEAFLKSGNQPDWMILEVVPVIPPELRPLVPLDGGRFAIVVGPYLKLHQCGLPKKMALELFKPFILRKLEERGIASSIKAAKKFIEKERPEVWDILEEVIREHPVLLNRAPTLHRLGIQAFEPTLIEGKAIQLHPLVCTAFNADFDGDQMAVHVPLSLEAQLEARVLMMSTNNILSPANGKPIIVPSQDIVLGLYHITMQRDGEPGEGMAFTSVGEIEQALAAKAVTLHSKIKARFETIDADGNPITQRVETTPGRMLLSEILPRSTAVGFELINQLLGKKAISELIDHVYRFCGQKETVIFCDRLMALGFQQACKAGISFGKDDLIIPEAKHQLVADVQEKVKEYEQQYQDGLITQREKYNKEVDAWTSCSEKVAEEMIKVIRTPQPGMPINSVWMMSDSGARGSAAQIKQLAGMRGLMTKPSGEIIATPIISNFKEGLTVLEYFNSTHGARKGLADTALKTANSGYLTRRLVDVAQDAIITEEDCGTTRGLLTRAVVDGGEIISPLADRIIGRCAAVDVLDPLSGEVVLPAAALIDEDAVDAIERAGIDAVQIRSVLTWESRIGVCGKCYGRDLARGTVVNIGEAVGVIAAQSIGEPGTQLTMRTFHIGRGAQRGAGPSSIEAAFDARLEAKNRNVVINSSGLPVVMGRNCEMVLVDDRGREKARHRAPYGARLLADEGVQV